MTRAVLLAAVSCAAGTAKPIGNAMTDHSQPRSRDELVRQAFAAISAGQIDTLVALADPRMRGAIRCPDEPAAQRRRTFGRQTFEQAVHDVAGTPIEIDSVRERLRGDVAPGDFVGPCVAAASLRLVELEIRVRGDG